MRITAASAHLLLSDRLIYIVNLPFALNNSNIKQKKMPVLKNSLF